jgi:hypothetical protein
MCAQEAPPFMFGRPSQAGPGASVSLKNGSATLLGATFSSHVCEHHCQPATTYGHRHTVNSKAYTLEIRFLICFLKMLCWNRECPIQALQPEEYILTCCNPLRISLPLIIFPSSVSDCSFSQLLTHPSSTIPPHLILRFPWHYIILSPR